MLPKRIRGAVGLLATTTLFAAAPALGWAHVACNCWSGDWICTYETEDHEILGYGYYPGHPNCD